MSDVIQVLTTVDVPEVAARLARSAVEARLAACAQVGGPITSTYWWEGRVEEAREWTVVFKTTSVRYPDLETHIRQGHPYDVPEIIATTVTGGSSAYLSWVETECADHSQ